MRVLFVTPYLPTLTKPRPHHFMRGLVERGHDVRLVALRDAEDTAAPAYGWEDLMDLVPTTVVDLQRRDAYRRCLRALPSKRALRVAYCDAPQLREAVAAAVEGFRPDLVHVDRERLGPVLADVAAPKVLDATDAISLYNRRLLKYGGITDRVLALAELPRMQSFESTMAEGYEAVLVTADEDADVLRSRCSPPTVVVPNGVDGRLLSARRQPEEGRILFVGNLFYPPNVDAVRWFAERVLPLVQLAVPNAALRLVGASPTGAVLRLATRPGVDVVGPVPDVLDELEHASVVVAPLRIGGGFPNKVAEALAAAAPLVATTAAVAGLPGVPHLAAAHIAGEPDAFAAAVVDVLRAPDQGASMGAEGRRLVQEHYMWPAVLDRLEHVYATALATKP